MFLEIDLNSFNYSLKKFVFIWYRGYYRCSSSKGCPARKQVERSRKDPTVVVITYACEHNHLIPTTIKHSQTTTTTTTIPAKFPPEELAVFANQPDLEPDNIDFAEFVADFGYFTNITSVILESTVITSPRCMEPDTAVIFTRGDDEDSLFADLGELPGCSLIFQQRGWTMLSAWASLQKYDSKYNIHYNHDNMIFMQECTW